MMKAKSLFILFMYLSLTACAQADSKKKEIKKMEKVTGKQKMKIEVWSDIMCPFCYIGKRNYEKAVQQFAGKDDIELIWKSFQLDPEISQENNKLDVYEYLAKFKGIRPEEAKQMHVKVEQVAKNAGLEYHLANTVIANSFDAHRLIQFAKERGLGDQAEERLFYANFTEGKDFGNRLVLTQIGKEIGLTQVEVTEALTNEKYALAVKHDLQEAREVGVTSVPFFVFDRKFAIAGAQSPQSFTQILEQSYNEWLKEHPKPVLEITNGPSCTPDGKCQ